MTPDIALRLQSMLRSVREVIVPALPASERLAIDQAQLVIGNLRILMEQHEYILHYALAELREFSTLLAKLAAVVDEPDQDGSPSRNLLDQAERLLVLNLPSYRRIDDLVRAIKGASDRLIQMAAERKPEVGESVTRLVLDQAARQIERERAWTGASGFDPERASLPPLSGLLRA